MICHGAWNSTLKARHLASASQRGNQIVTWDEKRNPLSHLSIFSVNEGIALQASQHSWTKTEEWLEVFEWSLARVRNFKCSPSTSHHPPTHTYIHSLECLHIHTQTHRCQRGLSDSTPVTGCLLWKQLPSSLPPSLLYSPLLPSLPLLWTPAWHTRPCSLAHIFTHRY